MTAAADAGGLSNATGASVSMVLESITGALGSTLRVVSTPLLVAAVGIMFLLCVAIGRRIVGEVRSGLAQPDPRDRWDPTASDVLGGGA